MKSFLIIPITISFLALVACSSEDNNTQENQSEEKEMLLENDPILGSWEIVEVDGPMRDENLGVVYTFNADGTMTLDNFEAKLIEKTDAQLTFLYKGADVEQKFNFTLNGDDLTLKPVINSVQVFYLKKKN